MPILIAAITAYLLGNLNGAVCVSALVAHEDVRNHGSGNAGHGLGDCATVVVDGVRHIAVMGQNIGISLYRLN